MTPQVFRSIHHCTRTLSRLLLVCEMGFAKVGSNRFCNGEQEEDPTQDKDRQTIQAMAMVDGRIGEASLDVLCFLDGSAPLRNKNGPAR